MANTSIAVARYIARGWRPVVVKPGGKVPLSKAWQNTTPKPDQFSENDNVGIRLGRTSGGLVDIDLDCPHARQLAGIEGLLWGLPAFGRAGDLPGHFLVNCGDAPDKVIQFGLSTGHGLPLPKDMVLELRANGQTVFPPSKYHRDDGNMQAVVWAAGAEPDTIPEMSWSELHLKAKALALLSVVLAAYPTRGNRDNVCMALAGTLVRIGIEPNIADSLVVRLAQIAGDDEADRRSGKALAASERISAGGEVTGLPSLIELLGLESCEKTIRKWLGFAKENSPLPEGGILVQQGDINGIIDKAEASLIAKCEPIYQRGGELIRVTRLDYEVDDEGINRKAGSIVLLPVRSGWLIQAMARSAPWGKIDSGRHQPIDPPEKYTLGLLSRAGEWRFPQLVGVAAAPTMAMDGRILQEPGFDRLSGLLLDIKAGAYPAVPPSPTMAEAEEALRFLLEPLRGFPFVDAISKAVAVAAILTGLIRPSMNTAPLHAFDAPTAGTGKSLLTSLVGIIATGCEPAAINQGKDNEEDEKRLGAALRSGDLVLQIDNCVRPIRGEFLCTMLTQSTVKVRILGLSELLTLPCRVLAMATGNNLEIAEDMTRRTVISRLDARMEQPETRSFNFDCLEEAHLQRPKLVVAGLTVLRAYVVAGRPGYLEPFGSFKDYDLVRGALTWLDMADPVASRAQLVMADPERAVLGEIMSLWRQTFVAKQFTVAGLNQVLSMSNSSAVSKMLELLQQLGNGKWDAPKIGRYFKKHRDRPIDGLILRGVMHSKLNNWWIEECDAVRIAAQPLEEMQRSGKNAGNNTEANLLGGSVG
jgi:hypothetical protein